MRRERTSSSSSTALSARQEKRSSTLHCRRLAIYPLTIGNTATPGDCEFNGMIDGVKIYAAALNLAEIRNEYACSRPWRIIFRSTGGGTELAWNYPHPCQTMQLLQNEEVIAEFPGDAEIESFVLEDSPEPGTVFQLRAIRADGSEELS